MRVVCFDFDDVLVDGNVFSHFLGSSGDTFSELKIGLGLLEDNAEPKKFFAAIKKLARAAKGIPYKQMERELKRLPLMAGAKETLQALHAQGPVVIVSTNDESLIRAFLKLHKIDPFIDHIYAARLHAKNGIFTGTISGDVLKTEKVGVIPKIERLYKVSRKDILYIGDGLTDIPILKIAGYGIFFNPTILTRAEIYSNNIFQKKIKNGTLFLIEDHDLRKILKLIQS